MAAQVEKFHARDAVKLPCGCVQTTAPGHIHTKLCARHMAEIFKTPYAVPADNFEDLL